MANWSALPEDVVPRILVHVLLKWKVPWRQINYAIEKNDVMRRAYVVQMRQLNRAFFYGLRPIAQVHGAPDRPYYVDRFVEGVLRIYGHAMMEGYKSLGEELHCHLNRTFYVEANVRPFPPHVARHYYSCIAGTMLRLLKDGTIRAPTHDAKGEMARDVSNVFMSLFYKPAAHEHTTNVTWVFSAHLPSPGAVIYSLMCPNTWSESYEMYRDHPGWVVV